MIHQSRLFIIFLIIILLLFIIIIIPFFISNQKSSSHKTFQDHDGYDDNIYSIRQLYAETFLFHDLPVVPTGIGQKIAILAEYLSVWYVEDILGALRFNGIYNKSAHDILSQISYVNATVIQDEPFDYAGYENLHVPLSNGVASQVRFNDVRNGSQELSTALQTIFCLLPDVNVVIYYIGGVPDCIPDSHGLPIDDNPLRTVIQYTIASLSQTKSFYNILCITILFDLPDQAGNFYEFLHELTNDPVHPITVVTTVRTALDSNRAFPSGYPNIINAGGVAWSSTRQPTAYLNSHGGYFTSSPYSYPNSTIPYYQVGTVPNHQDSFIHANHYMGCPDVSGNMRNLAVFFDTYPNPVHYETISIPVVAYACLFAMTNAGSNSNKWNYPEIFYKYPNFLFHRVTTGQNDRHDVANYRGWNPCAGLGIVRGLNLAKILAIKYLQTGTPIQFSSVIITEKMSYLNFFPCSPLQDPLNMQPEHDYYNSLPSFGPQSIWSSLMIYKIDLTTGRVNMQNRQFINHGDTVVILFQTQFFQEVDNAQLYYILECFNENTVRIHTFYSNEVSYPIDSRYKWVITKEFGIEPSPIELFDKCRILPVNYQALGVCLSSRYLTSEDSIFATCPSLQSLDSLNPDPGTIFQVCPHTYQFMDFRDGHVPERSYFVNLTNYREFWSSGVHATDISNIIHARRSASTPTTLPFVRYESTFDSVPQWLLIPLSVEQNNSLSLQFGNYAIFNTRLRSFVYFDNDDTTDNHCLQMIHINPETAARYRDLLPYCTFRFSPIEQYQDNPTLFIARPPMNELDSQILINEFLCPLQIYFDSPYFNDNGNNSQGYTLFVSDQDFIQNHLNYVKLDRDCPNTSRPTTFCFHIHPEHLVSQYTDIIISVPDTHININNNARFINNAVSSDVSNSYVRMIPLSDGDWRNNMLWKSIVMNAETVPDFENPNEFIFPVMDFNNNNHLTLENAVYSTQYLIHSDGGWKPRLGYARNNNDPGIIWSVSPNYLNKKPSDTDALLLTGNYFYRHTFYYFNSTSGTLTCSLNVPHLPALLTEITSENADTLYYSSQFFIL